MPAGAVHADDPQALVGALAAHGLASGIISRTSVETSDLHRLTWRTSRATSAGGISLIAALREGRDAWGCELDPEYIVRSQGRISTEVTMW